MIELAGYGTLGLTVGLVLTRPHVRTLEIGPAMAVLLGVLIMAAAGLVDGSELRRTAEVVWRPLITVSSIMVMTGAASRLGAIDQLSAVTLARPGSTATRFFTMTYLLSGLMAAVLNNDAAILLVTPIVLSQVWVVYPDNAELRIPFAFAVFTAAGVAPLVVSNPMNLIVATYAGIGFNEYLVHMAPVWLFSNAVGLGTLLLLFRRRLAEAPPVGPRRDPGPWTAPQVHVLITLALVLAAYPVVAYFDGPIWAVALGGGALSVLLCWKHLRADPVTVVREAVPWQILVFLAGMLTIAFGLENAGVVDRLANVYDGAGLATVAVVSAGGSAVVNNHPMALMSLLGLEAADGADHPRLLAALVGGDLGPNLLPIGSLAGMLWLEILRRGGVTVTLRHFMFVGVIVTLPSLAVALAVLSLTTS